MGLTGTNLKGKEEETPDPAHLPVHKLLKGALEK